MYKCPECILEKENILGLSVHYRAKHKKTARDLSLALFHNGIEPVCACGCGEITKFHGIKVGWSEYRQGHIARVKNNWGHNEKALNKSHATTKARYVSGDLEVWNKGLIKETNEIVKKYGKTNSEQSWDNNKKQEYSKRMRNNRLNGIIPTLYGKDSSQWKGGISPLSAMCHSNNRLFNEWKYPKLKAANFQCTRCGASKDLCIHHDKERMAEIIHKFYDLLIIDGELNDLQKSMIVESVTTYHIDNNVSGVVLCYDCHKEEHPGLNF